MSPAREEASPEAPDRPAAQEVAGVRDAKAHAISRLACGIAHELNNHLTVIETGTAFALKAVEPGSQVAEDIEDIRAAGRRIVGLMQELRTLDTRRRLSGPPTEVGACLERLHGAIDAAAGPTIEVVLGSADPGLGVRADEKHLERVLTTLAAHAAASMPEGGHLTVVARAVSGRSGEVEVSPQGFVQIGVTLAGPGLVPDDAERIFEPFFAPKLDGHGLGLAAAHGTVRQLGGILEVSTAPGEGTTFHIRLPRADPLDDMEGAGSQ